MDTAGEDDPAAWRSAVDAKSGRTYWYHRTTRQTTWKMPECLVEVQKNNEGNGGYKELASMLDGLATPSELIDLLDKPPIETQFEVLKIIFNCCLPSTASAWAQHSGFIDKLSNIIMRTHSVDIRVLCLRILFGLAAAPECAPAFRVSKGWISIADGVSKWKDVNSAVLFSFFISLLCAGVLKAYIPKALLDQLLTDLQSRGDDASSHDEEPLMFIQHPNPQGSSILCAHLMSILSSQGGKSTEEDGHLLPAVVFIVVTKCAFRSQHASVSFCKNGGFSILQSMCVNRQLPESIRAEVISMVRAAMRSSDYLQTTVLNAWVGLASDLYSAQEMFPAAPHSSPIEITERDVELRSTVGKKAVKMHSAMLWLRCPGLRGIIEDLWAERRAEGADTNSRGMEISLEASDAVLGALHQYIMTSILAPLPLQGTDHHNASEDPALGADLLELAKVACELEMQEFELCISRHICQVLYWNKKGYLSPDQDDTRLEEEIDVDERLALQRLESCMLFAEKWGLQLLSKFLATVQYYMSVETSMASGELEDENNKSSMVLADTCFTPMKFGRKNSRPQASPSRGDRFGGESIVMSGSDMGSRHQTSAQSRPVRNGHDEDIHDDLHQQVIASLEEVSFAISDDRQLSKPAAAQPVPREVRCDTHHPSSKADSYLPNYGGESYLDSYAAQDEEEEGYCNFDSGNEYNDKDSLLRDSASSDRQAPVKSRGPPLTAAQNQRNADASRSANNKMSTGRSRIPPPTAGKKFSKQSTGFRSSNAASKPKSVSGKKGQGHGGMYELLIAAGAGTIEDIEDYSAAVTDPSLGDYSSLYTDLDRRKDNIPTHERGGSSDARHDRYDDGSEGYSGNSDHDESPAQPAYVPKRTPGKVPKGGPPRGATAAASPAKGKTNKPISASSRLGAHHRDRSVGSSSEGLDAGVYEYDPRRDSLGVAPKMSATEKRLNELSQPKAKRERSARKKPREDPAEGEESAAADNAESVSNSVDVDVIASGPGAAVAESTGQNSKPNSVQRDTETPPPLPAPSSLSLPVPPTVDSSVRASLKLLKSKRRSSAVPSPIPTITENPVPSVSVDLSASVNLTDRAGGVGASIRPSTASGKLPSAPKPKPKTPVSRGPAAAATVAPVDCTRSSGCTCALCSMPIESFAPVSDASSNRFRSNSNDNHPGELVARETELQKKRKAYNAKKASIGKPSSSKPPVSEKWKMQSQQFRAAMRAARGVGGGAAEEEVPTRDVNGVPFGMVHCDGCGRNFNPESGARHMLVCKDIKAKPKMLVRGGGRSAVNPPKRK